MRGGKDTGKWPRVKTDARAARVAHALRDTLVEMRAVFFLAVGATLVALVGCPSPAAVPKGPPPEYELEDASAVLGPALPPASDGGR